MIFPYCSIDSQGLMELSNISRYVSSLETIDLDFLPLLHFAGEPATSAYEYMPPVQRESTKFSMNPKPDTFPDRIITPDDTWFEKTTANMYRDAKNQMPKLVELKLIEKVMVQPNLFKAKKYKLTEYGVYYFVMKSYLTGPVIKNLLMFYGNHPLFRCFVYPWISKDTLLHMKGDYDSFFSLLSSYLGDCCEMVKQENLSEYDKRVQQLISSIVLDDSIKPNTRKILAQDESFRQILDDTKNQFDQGYKFFE
ncbi:MAG: hypothetical protein WA667_23430 [Candidatus Nitrosopolaris sp.]